MYMYTHMYVYIHTYMSISLSLSLSLYIYIYIYIHIHIHVHIRGPPRGGERRGAPCRKGRLRARPRLPNFEYHIAYDIYII